MFCFQCQETAKNTGCTVKGVCGKPEETANFQDKLFTTGVVGYDGAMHIADRPAGGAKDFSALIEKAKTCLPPTEIETGTIVGGFAHNQVLALADKVVDAVKYWQPKRMSRISRPPRPTPKTRPAAMSNCFWNR